jgi:hypothetical protein
MSRTYEFTVTLPSYEWVGPLAGVVAKGSLSFDEAIVPVGGFGFVNGQGLLSSFSFSWNGITYDESTANAITLVFGGAPYLGIAPPGELTGFVLGNHCQDVAAPNTCLVLNGTNDWRATAVPFASTFFYAYPGVLGAFGVGQTTNAPNGPIKIAPVPEPATYVGMIAGLGVLGLFARRRRS